MACISTSNALPVIELRAKKNGRSREQKAYRPAAQRQEKANQGQPLLTRAKPTNRLKIISVKREPSTGDGIRSTKQSAVMALFKFGQREGGGKKGTPALA